MWGSDNSKNLRHPVTLSTESRNARQCNILKVKKKHADTIQQKRACISYSVDNF